MGVICSMIDCIANDDDYSSSCFELASDGYGLGISAWHLLLLLLLLSMFPISYKSRLNILILDFRPLAVDNLFCVSTHVQRLFFLPFSMHFTKDETWQFFFYRTKRVQNLCGHYVKLFNTRNGAREQARWSAVLWSCDEFAPKKA